MAKMDGMVCFMAERARARMQTYSPANRSGRVKPVYERRSKNRPQSAA
jgi:hypothetical protein